MSGGGNSESALDTKDKKNRVSLEIENNDMLLSILQELKMIYQQLKIITGEEIRDNDREMFN